MSHTIEKRNPASNRFSLWVVFTMAFVTPLCWWSLRQIRLENETQQWISDSDPDRRAQESTQDRFKLHDRVLLTWDGSSFNDPRFGKLVEQLVGNRDSTGKRRGGSPYVQSVSDPRAYLEVMQSNGIEPQEAVRRLEGTLIGAGTMKLRLTENARSALKKSKRDLQTAFKSKFGKDLEIFDAALDLSTLVSIPAPAMAKDGEPAASACPPVVLSVDGQPAENSTFDHDLQVSWNGMHVGSETTIAAARWMTEFIPERNGGEPIAQACFFVPGSPAALEVELSEAGLAEQGEAVNAIRLACQNVGIPVETVRLSGAALNEAELNDGAAKTVWNASFPLLQINQRSVLLTSVIACAVLAFAAIRKLRLSSAILIASVFAVGCTLAIIPAAKSTVNQVLVVLPVILFGLTISGGIHFVSAWKQSGLEKDATTALDIQLESRRNILIACVAVATGFLTLCTVRFAPVWDLGIYGTVGCAISAITLVYCLPSLIQVLNIRPIKEQPADPFAWAFFGRQFATHAHWQFPLMAVICLGCTYELTRLPLETKPYGQWPENARIVKDYGKIETDLAGCMSAETVIGFDSQSVKDTNFLDRLELVRSVEELIRKHPDISGCLSIADFQTVSDRPAEDANFSQRTKYNKRSAIAQQKITDGEIPFANAFYVAASESTSNVAGAELWRVSIRVNSVGNARLPVILDDLHRTVKGVLKMQPGSDHKITGELPLFAKSVDTLSISLIVSFCVTSALTIGLMMFSLSNLLGGLTTVIASLTPIAMFAAACSWFGISVQNEFLLAFPLSTAMMFDGKRRYLKQCQALLRTGLSRVDAASEAFVLKGPFLCQTTVVFALGFIILSQSELPFINRFSTSMAILLGLTLLTDLVLLPQLVAGPMGRVFETQRPVAIEASKVEAIEVPVAEQPAAVNPEAEAIPSPHIKPHVPPLKKRRSAARREPDSE